MTIFVHDDVNEKDNGKDDYLHDDDDDGDDFDYDGDNDDDDPNNNEKGKKRGAIIKIITKINYQDKLIFLRIRLNIT